MPGDDAQRRVWENKIEPPVNWLLYRAGESNLGKDSRDQAFLASTSSVKSLIFVNPLQKSGDLGTKFYQYFSNALGGQILLLDKGTLASRGQRHFGRCGFIWGFLLFSLVD